MYRNHSDRRLLPSRTASTDSSIFFSSANSETPTIAPCIPEAAQSTTLARRRPVSNGPGHVVGYSRSSPSLTQPCSNDTISEALGLQSTHILNYSRGIPDLDHADLTARLSTLSLNDTLDIAMGQKNHTESFFKALNPSILMAQQQCSTDSGSLDTPRPSSDTNLDAARARLRSREIRYRRSNSANPRTLVETLVSSSRSDSAKEGSVSQSSASKKEVKEMVELQYLVTYNLVNNFYFNLVSWSPFNNSIAIAIDRKAYWWDGSSSVKDMKIHRTSVTSISCISCSPKDAIAVAFSDGLFCVYKISKQARPVIKHFGSLVQCIKWFPDGSHLVVGESSGAVCVFMYDGTSLTLVSNLAGFSQQICGVAIDKDLTQVAVGGNENLAIVWDIQDLQKPKEKCRLHHKSAVKGISFCPWAPSLLATGGGSNDRHLRFWHTGSGTLLSEFDTKRQITSIFWSSYYKEVMLTFGFSTTEENFSAAIYEYPGIKHKASAFTRDPIRALSATVAPDETKVAIAANDGTVRVFGLWETRSYMLASRQSTIALGSYGSVLVEHSEDIGVRSEPIR